MPSIALTDRLPKSVAGCAVLFVALSFAPALLPVAHAQDNGSQKEQSDNEETAKKVLEVIRQANKAFEAEDYETAFDKYEQAYELYPDPAILVRLGKTAEKLDRHKKAAGYYREFVRLMPDDPASEGLAQRADELEAQASVTVRVTSEPSGAQIYLDDGSIDSVARTPAEISLDAGKHTLYVKRKGFETVKKEITVEPGKDQSIAVTLSRTAPDVQADTSVEPVGRDTSTIVTVGWASLGLGVASLTTSLVFNHLKGQAEDDVNNYDKRAPGASPEELDELKDNANTHYDAAVVTGIAGGVFAATGVGLLTYHFLTNGDDEKDVAVNVGAGFDAESAWFGVNGRF